jgi:hypothetical protein
MADKQSPFTKIFSNDSFKKPWKIKFEKALLIIISSASLLFYSCSAQKSGNLDPVSVKELKTRVNENSKVIESLEASGNISFDSPENSGSGWLELRIKKPDTVFVKIEGPFGISIANALITRNEFMYYNAG